MALEAYAEDTPPPRQQRQRLTVVPVATVQLAHRIDEVSATWAALEAAEIESPGQSAAFTRAWVGAFGIAEADQFYLTAVFDGEPVALLPLWRRRVKGVRLLSWFPGPHIGCNAPLVDAARLATLGSVERAALWSAMLETLEGADLIYLKSVPQLFVAGVDIFAELGQTIEAETLYRAQFASWDDANTTQRSKSRRKHDRQQGERLEALGQVEFEEVRGGPEALPILDVMFRQRAARFVAMGVPDPFAEPGMRAFYDATLSPAAGVDVRLHVLRLNGEIVAVRYNIAHGERLFCLISSMSDDATIQTGSPGKQCLLRVMQTVFDAGYRVFDMGAGFTDEKRHWCNLKLPVRQHYVPLTKLGTVAAKGHLGWQVLRQKLKANKVVMGLVKAVRGRMLRSSTPAEAKSDD
ncbi:MAG: GNAT family N-acetyltransferase [Hyphomicrobiales bacterium]|nr:MAG: GNAT family N-acetyltransferase [Hyphomicrobiales bacterium]